MQPNSTEPHAAPMQFSMKTLFVVTTGVAMLASAGAWSPLALIAAIVVVGAWWSWLAVRAEAHNVAYYLTTCVQGALLTGFFTSTPMLGAHTSLVYMMIAAFCGSAILTTRILRRLILRQGGLIPWLAGILSPYSVAACLAIEIWTYEVFFNPYSVVGDGPGLMVFLLFAVPILVTCVLPLAGPVGIFFCTWLRAVGGARYSPPPFPNDPVTGRGTKTFIETREDRWPN